MLLAKILQNTKESGTDVAIFIRGLERALHNDAMSLGLSSASTAPQLKHICS